MRDRGGLYNPQNPYLINVNLTISYKGYICTQKEMY